MLQKAERIKIKKNEDFYKKQSLCKFLKMIEETSSVEVINKSQK